MNSSISTDIDIPHGLQAILMNADERTRNQIYVRLKNYYLPHTDPKQMDRLIRTLAEICRI